MTVHRPTAVGRTDALLIGGLLLWAMLIQHPWRAVAPPVSDMGPILTSLHKTSGFLAGTAGLVKGFALEGRFMPGSMLVLAGKHEAFGLSGVDWRWGGFGICAALVVAAYVALRRFTVAPLAAFAGAGLFIYSDHASAAWLLPQVMEPVASLLLIASILLATRFRQTARPVRTAFVIGLALVATIWVKEPVIAAVPFVVFVALFWRDGMWETGPPRDRVRVLLVSIMLLVGVLNVAPILWVRTVAENPEYASRYSAATLSLATLSNALRASLLPVTRVPWFPANVAALLVVLLGALAAARKKGRRQALLWVVIPLALPFSIALIYAPWPSYPGFYALPGTFGLALLLGAALTSVRGWTSHARTAAAAAGVAMALLGTLIVRTAAATYAAERALEVRVARQLREVRAPTALAYGNRTPAFSGAYGSSLIAYSALFFGRSSLTTGIDVTCDEARRLVASSQTDTLVVAFGTECPNLPRQGTVTVQQPLVTHDWKTLRRRADTLKATIADPSIAPTSRANQDTVSRCESRASACV